MICKLMFPLPTKLLHDRISLAECLDLLRRARDQFHWGFMSSYSKSCAHSSSSHFNNNTQIRSQFCTCHDSWAVVTCANLWHDPNEWNYNQNGEISIISSSTLCEMCPWLQTGGCPQTCLTEAEAEMPHGTWCWRSDFRFSIYPTCIAIGTLKKTIRIKW